MYADELFQDRLQTEEIQTLDGVLHNNKVLVEVDGFIYDTLETKSGLRLWIDNSEQVGQHVVRHGRVVKVPNRLWFWDENKIGMTWRTEIEICVDDTVWFYAITSFDAEKLSFKGRKFILLNYEDLYVAKRNNEVICLNGNVLLEPLYRTVKALSYTQTMLDATRAKIAFIGSINTQYDQDIKEDDPDLKQGMVVLLSGQQPRFMEDKKHLFFDGREYIVVQNQEIIGYLNE